MSNITLDTLSEMHDDGNRTVDELLAWLNNHCSLLPQEKTLVIESALR